MKRLAAFSASVTVVFFCLFLLDAFADEIEVAPGIKALDPSNTGAAVLRIPIEVPPGRKGIAPNVVLSYNSGSGYGWVGKGWSLEMGAIQRSTKNGVNYSANDFIFLKDDASIELLPRGDWGTNRYGAKIEGAFTKYYYNSSTGGWEATTKDGLTYYYGSTTASRQNNPWDLYNNSQVLKWFLDRVQDPNGNYLTLSYVSNQGSAFLSRIDYTGNTGGLGPINYLLFSRDDKNLLSRIDVYAGTQLVRSLSLSYTESPNTGRSLLTDITRYGSDGSSTLPAITFSYQTSQGGFTGPFAGPATGSNIAAGDFTGDGRADIADASTVITSNLTSIYYSQGSSFSSSATFSTPVPSCPLCLEGGGCINAMTVSSVAANDFNGDGAADLALTVLPHPTADCTPSYSPYNVYYSNHSSGQLSSFSQIPLPFTTNVKGDFNGDGITDFASAACVSADPGNFYAVDVSIAHPNGQFSTTSWYYGFSPGCSYSPTGGCLYSATGDFNGDGKTDLLFYACGDGYAKIFFSTGSSFVERWVTNDFYYGNVIVGDFDGDGRSDIAVVSGSANVTYVYSAKANFTSYEAWNTPSLYGIIISKLLAADFNGDGKADLLIAGCLNNGSGGCAGASFTNVYHSTGIIPDLLRTVTSGLGGVTTLFYAPSTAYSNQFLPVVTQAVSSITLNDGNGNVSTTNYTYHGGLFRNREFRGFNYVKATAPSGTTTETWYHQDDVFKGLVFDQGIKDASGNIYAASHNEYLSTSPYTGVNFPRLTDKFNYIYDGVTTRKETRISFAYDDYGNIARKYSWGNVTVTGDERDEYTDYNYDTAKWIVNLPSHMHIYDSGGTKKAETWLDYDSKGNLLTKTLGLVLGNKYNVYNPKVRYGYDDYGNQITATDPVGNITAIGYDPTRTYPWTVTNPLNQHATTTYDYRFGKPLTKTDFNFNAVTYQYDVFGRLQTETDSHSGWPAYAWQETYYDGLGRVIKAKRGGPEGKVIVTETKYNILGQVFKTSLPYFENLEQPRWATYYYDPIGRMTDVQNPDNTLLRKRYMQGSTTLVDANSHQKVEERDAYGRLVKVEEYTGTYPNASLYATTTYEYDVLGNLTKTTDARGNQTIIHYDPLSRKTDMQDPDMGYWRYEYDLNGNLVAQIDARSQRIGFTYDELNRIETKHYPAGPEVIYTYDEPWSTNYRGRLTTVSDASGTEKFYYDTLGRVTTSKKAVDGVDYPINTAYDELGRAKTITYPDGETVHYSYDAGGNLTTVSNYATFSNFNALGQAGTAAYANGVTTTRQYYATHNRLWSITTRDPGQGDLQTTSYGYDYGGNINTVIDHLDSSRTQTFTYDELNRLRQAQSAAYATPTINYDYDQIGNMIYNSRVGSYAYGPKPHAALQAGSNSYTYDANGSMQTRNGVLITHDYDNRPVSIGSTSFVYDYSGQRVKKSSRVYIGKLYECVGSSCVKYVFAGGMRIASQSSNRTYFYHGDHLGSSNIITDERGYKVQETCYYPFGETRYNSGNAVYHKFTGQEEDPETGLYYYGARYYEPRIGRFISADSIVQAPFDPQTLNRYSYVQNNPIIYTDPSGHFSWGDLFNVLDPGTYLARKGTGYLIDNFTSGSLQNVLQGMDSGFWGSISPQLAAKSGGLAGVVGWITGGTLSYSYEGGWGAHAGGGYYCFFGSTSWQSRGAGAGWHQTVGIGYQYGYFMAGLALSYHFSQDYLDVGAYAGGAADYGSAGVNYSLTSGTFSGWSSVSVGKILRAIRTSDSGRFMQVANAGYFSEAESVTGYETDPNGPMGEKTWYMTALDRFALHPLSVVHDHWVTQRGLSGGGEFWASIVTSAFIGRGMAGPVRTNPYGFQMDAGGSGYIW